MRGSELDSYEGSLAILKPGFKLWTFREQANALHTAPSQASLTYPPEHKECWLGKELEDHKLFSSISK